MEKPLNLPLLLETIKKFLTETAADYARRLTDPQFKTLFLNPHGNDFPAGNVVPHENKT